MGRQSPQGGRRRSPHALNARGAGACNALDDPTWSGIEETVGLGEAITATASDGMKALGAHPNPLIRGLLKRASPTGILTADSVPYRRAQGGHHDLLRAETSTVIGGPR
jgi:hypothetical protein